jgi:hypothetical protein
MPKVTYIEFSGVARAVEVPVGLSLMIGAVNNGTPTLRRPPLAGIIHETGRGSGGSGTSRAGLV